MNYIERKLLDSILVEALTVRGVSRTDLIEQYSMLLACVRRRERLEAAPRAAGECWANAAVPECTATGSTGTASDSAKAAVDDRLAEVYARMQSLETEIHSL